MNSLGQPFGQKVPVLPMVEPIAAGSGHRDGRIVRPKVS
jgi:hypothetical protein